MNKHIKSLLACAAAALTLAGCEMNDFNENYLEGFDPDTTITDIKTVTLELTADDYSAIASNTTNKALANTLGGNAPAALAAIGTNKYFSSSEDAQAFIPAWIAANYPTADDGSSANVTYALANGMPENVAAMNAMKAYTLTTDDYKTVWGSETDYVEAITPATASKLATVISAEELEAGDYVAVTYKYSATEPTFGGTEDPGTDPDQPKDPETPAVDMAGKYIIAATKEGTDYVAAALGADKTYGYISGKAYTIEGTSIAAADVPEDYVWTFANDGEGYTIQDYNGHYYYLDSDPSHNSFQKGAARTDNDTDYFTWTIKLNSDGEVIITNTGNGKWIQQGDGSYSSFGPYATQTCNNPRLYRLNAAGTAYELYTGEEAAAPAEEVYALVSSFDGAGDYLIIATKEGTDYAMTALDAGKTYGYASGTTFSVTGTAIAAADVEEKFVWTFAATADGYTIQDYNGHYYYMDDDAAHVSFQKSATMGEGNYAWTISIAANNEATITNVGRGNWIQQGDGTYTTFGIYDTQKANNPRLYKKMSASAAATYSVLTRAAAVTTVNQYGIYNFNGSKFTDAGNVIVQPADFTAMGNTYGSFTNPDQDTYLPKFLAANYPYAKEGDTKYVSFRCFNSGTTSWKTDEYVFDSSAWVKNDYIEATSDKFERTNKTWTWNPSVTLYYPPVRNESNAMAFYQAVTDWVWANIDQPMGITSKGGGFVTSYGNNEYYTGCSAYYNNVDLRASKAREQYSGESYQGNDLVAAGVAFSGDAYDSLSDDEAQELMIKRLQYVVGKTLEGLYPDMRTIGGIEIFYTVHLALYRGEDVKNCNAYLKYKVAGPAQLEFVEMVEY